MYINMNNENTNLLVNPLSYCFACFEIYEIGENYTEDEYDQICINYNEDCHLCLNCTENKYKYLIK